MNTAGRRWIGTFSWSLFTSWRWKLLLKQPSFKYPLSSPNTQISIKFNFPEMKILRYLYPPLFDQKSSANVTYLFASRKILIALASLILLPTCKCTVARCNINFWRISFLFAGGNLVAYGLIKPILRHTNDYREATWGRWASLLLRGNDNNNRRNNEHH